MRRRHEHLSQYYSVYRAMSYVGSIISSYLNTSLSIFSLSVESSVDRIQTNSNQLKPLFKPLFKPIQTIQTNSNQFKPHPNHIQTQSGQFEPTRTNASPRSILSSRVGLAGWQAGRRPGWLSGRLAGWQAGWLQTGTF